VNASFVQEAIYQTICLRPKRSFQTRSLFFFFSLSLALSLSLSAYMRKLLSLVEFKGKLCGVTDWNDDFPGLFFLISSYPGYHSTQIASF